jgi:hypothetical protein
MTDQANQIARVCYVVNREVIPQGAREISTFVTCHLI